MYHTWITEDYQTLTADVTQSIDFFIYTVCMSNADPLPCFMWHMASDSSCKNCMASDFSFSLSPETKDVAVDVADKSCKNRSGGN